MAEIAEVMLRVFLCPKTSRGPKLPPSFAQFHKERYEKAPPRTPFRPIVGSLVFYTQVTVLMTTINTCPDPSSSLHPWVIGKREIYALFSKDSGFLYRRFSRKSLLYFYYYIFFTHIHTLTREPHSRSHWIENFIYFSDLISYRRKILYFIRFWEGKTKKKGKKVWLMIDFTCVTFRPSWFSVEIK